MARASLVVGDPGPCHKLSCMSRSSNTCPIRSRPSCFLAGSVNDASTVWPATWPVGGGWERRGFHRALRGAGPASDCKKDLGIHGLFSRMPSWIWWRWAWSPTGATHLRTNPWSLRPGNPGTDVLAALQPRVEFQSIDRRTPATLPSTIGRESSLRARWISPGTSPCSREETSASRGPGVLHGCGLSGDDIFALPSGNQGRAQHPPVRGGFPNHSPSGSP
jgi:hypothetical protein